MRNVDVYDELKKFLDSYNMRILRNNDLNFLNFILPRFQNLDYNLEKIYSFYEIYYDESDLNIKPLGENGGEFTLSKNLLSVYVPVMCEKKNSKIKDGDQKYVDLYNTFYVIETLFTFQHELKHCYDFSKMIDILKTKKISLDDLFKLWHLVEKSAEIQSIFWRCYFYQGSYYSGIVEEYRKIDNFVKEHPDYYATKFSEFFDCVYNTYVSKENVKSIYNDKYFLETFKSHLKFFNTDGNVVSKTPDNSVYLELKKELFSFDFYNPKTKKWELRDCSNLVEDPIVSEKNLNEVRKFYNASYSNKDIKLFTFVKNFLKMK